MTKYTLYVHSYDVFPKIPLFPSAHHTGFELRIETNDGIIVKSIDLGPDSNGNIKFYFDKEYGEGESPIDGRVVLLHSDEALAVFNKISIATSILDLYNLDFNSLARNCNSSTEVLVDRYVPGYAGGISKIFDHLPGVYVGDEYNLFKNNNDVKIALSIADALIEKLNGDGINLENAEFKWLDGRGTFVFVSINGSLYFIDKYGMIYEKGTDGLYQAVLGDMLQQCLLPIKEKICKIKTLFSEGSEVRSPLVVDLDGDGVETVSAENGVYFDHDGNGFKENSG